MDSFHEGQRMTIDGISMVVLFQICQHEKPNFPLGIDKVYQNWFEKIVTDHIWQKFNRQQS